MQACLARVHATSATASLPEGHGRYVEHYNHVRLHSAIGYVAPADKLAGREVEIFAVRDRKLAEARQRRKEQREATHLQTVA